MRTVVIDELTPAEKLDLIDELWASLESEYGGLSQAQWDELDRRLETADADAARGKTWAQIKEESARGRQ